MSSSSLKRLLCAIAALTLMASANTWAAAGKAIFVYGTATLVSADGNRSILGKGDVVESGDTVVTAANGRVQLQMVDGGLLALRPGTELRIEKFNHPQAGRSGGDERADLEPASFFELVKGGFRSITGAIGKADKSNYRVRTPVATIGIRGTDYDALYCAGDCQAIEKSLGRSIDDGLYVGVNSGGVRLTNEAGSVDLNVGDHGFAAGRGAAPSKSDLAADVLAPATTADVNTQDAATTAAVPTSRPDTGLEATDSAGNPIDLNAGGSVAVDTSGAVAHANLPGAGTGVTAAGSANQIVDASGDVVSFTTSDGVGYASGSTQSTNVGRDTERPNATGISWGRWANGQVNVSDADGSSLQPVDGSVHWVAGPANAPVPVLPTTGTQSFNLIGNTDPTDNAGNVGTLGSASLSADFDAQTVDADVSLSFDQTNQVWDASAQDIDINSADATFEGAFDAVTITESNLGGVQNGSGDLGGFFSGNDAGDVSGAGLTYSLSDDAGTDVSGSAAFQARPAGN